VCETLITIQIQLFFRNISACPPWKSPEEFLIVPSRSSLQSAIEHETNPQFDTYKEKVDGIVAEETLKVRYQNFHANRTAVLYDSYWDSQKVIHFISKPELGLRLLEPFYTYIYFQDDKMDKFYKRFIRDYVHYMDTIFCKAAVIVKHLLREGSGSYSSFHIRRLV
jgi:hypothetical protein